MDKYFKSLILIIPSQKYLYILGICPLSQNT
jgi:hypothetical protein